METVEEKIVRLKKEKGAIILAHNYQRPEVQDIADFAGDSLELSIKAAEVQEKTIVFCGVLFMAESAKVLSPEKTVLLPNANAGCPMADMITAEQLRELKAQHPKANVLCYVNSSAEVKAESDLCCTSSNAAKIIEHGFAPEDEIIFVPDQWLATVTEQRTGRSFIKWPGYCPTHSRILPEDIETLRELNPGAKVVAHPECPQEICDMADALLATGQMSAYAANSDADTFIIATEKGMLHRLENENPTKKFVHASPRAVCSNMKKITLEHVANALENMESEIILDEDIRQKAEGSIKRMVDISKKYM